MKMSWRGEPGLSGPTSKTFFEVKDERWSEKYTKLQSLCFQVMQFLETNPEIAETVIITDHEMKSMLRSK